MTEALKSFVALTKELRVFQYAMNVSTPTFLVVINAVTFPSASRICIKSTLLVCFLSLWLENWEAIS